MENQDLDNSGKSLGPVIKKKATPEKKARRRDFMHPRYLGSFGVLLWIMVGFEDAVLRQENPWKERWERLGKRLQPHLPPEASVEEICEAYARAFCGLDERYCPIRGWTGTKEAAQFLLHNAFVRPDLPDEAEPLVVLKAYFQALAQLFLKARAALEAGDVSEDVYRVIGACITAHAQLDLRGKWGKRGFLLPCETWFDKASARKKIRAQQFFVHTIKSLPNLQDVSFCHVQAEEVKTRLSRGFTAECAATMGGQRGYGVRICPSDTSLYLAEKYALVFTGRDGSFFTDCEARGTKLADTLMLEGHVKVNGPLGEAPPYEVLKLYFYQQARVYYEEVEKYDQRKVTEQELGKIRKILQKKIIQDIAENF